MKAPEAYPQGYVEDACEARTKLAGYFSILRRIRRFDSPIARMIPLMAEGRILRTRRLDTSMADNNALYAIRFPDGSLSLYIDEDYAIERGVDPATLTRVEIPRDMFVSGTIQEIREYVALYLESRHSGTA